MYQLELLGPEGPTSQHPLSSRPFVVGRGASSDLILLDDATSTRHFRVWLDADAAFVEDLGSRNGTWINGERLNGIRRLCASDEIRLGATVRMRLREGEALGVVPQVEDMDLGVRYRFASDRFSIGQRVGSDIVITAAGPGATLLIERDGEIWLGGPDEVTRLYIDRPFMVAGRRFCLRHPEGCKR